MDGLEELTDKEKETLRLIVRGHDAKSMASELSLSVHTINERLREARRKLGVTSSREAGRLLFEHEGADHQNLADKHLGEAPRPVGDQFPASPAPGRWARPRLALVTAGVLIMLTIIAALALANQTTTSPPRPVPAETAASDRVIEDSARRWLSLVDGGQWQASFEAAGRSFREVNTVSGWTDASNRARTPLGQVLSRELVEVKYVNAPPRGYRSVAFFTTFSDGGEAIEMVTLEREANDWRVVGYVIE